MPSDRHPHFARLTDPRPPAADPAEVARLRAEVAHVTRELADTYDQEVMPDWVRRWAAVLAIVLFTVASLWVTGQLGRLAR